MVTTEQDKAQLLRTIKQRDAVVEIMVDYKRGLRNLQTASAALAHHTGILPEFGAALLRSMSRNNVTQIRGYSKEPERTLKGKIGKPNECKNK